MYKRKYYKRPINRDKYSIEQTNIISPPINEWPSVTSEDPTHQASSQYAIPIVPPIEEQGMRKVKHLTISMSNNTAGDTLPFFYSIVYVPQGYDPQPIVVPASGYAVGNYQANQFVMSSGVVDFSAGPTRIRSRLSRNLNSGDAIYLILATTNASNTGYIVSQVQYAITLQ